jgi:hypothetical protein
MSALTKSPPASREAVIVATSTREAAEAIARLLLTAKGGRR